MFKKIVLLTILALGVVYVSSNIYFSKKDQKAQSLNDGIYFSGGTIADRRFPINSQVKYTLTSNKPVNISTLYAELLPVSGADGTINGMKTITLAVEPIGTVSTVTTFMSRIPESAVMGTYELRVGDRDINSQLSWHFDGTVEVVHAEEFFTAKTLTPTENEQRVTNFAFSVQQDVKDQTLYHFEWSGAGRGISFREVKGSGSKYVKQLSYQNLFPLDDSGFKDILPFFALPNDGVGETGKGDIRLINTANKEQTIDVIIAPKGEDGSPAVNFAKTVTVKILPSAYKINSLSKTKNNLKAGDTVVAVFAPSIPLPQLAAPLRTSDTVSLSMTKTGKGQKPVLLSQPQFTTENTMIFTIPTNTLPGSYKLSLKTYLGLTTYDVKVVK